jgi:delta 1-pyrroline-5-carboxylate dehydrogenase
MRQWATMKHYWLIFVRRLLENGANTSFVNRIADKSLQLMI